MLPWEKNQRRDGVVRSDNKTELLLLYRFNYFPITAHPGVFSFLYVPFSNI